MSESPSGNGLRMPGGGDPPSSTGFFGGPPPKNLYEVVGLRPTINPNPFKPADYG